MPATRETTKRDLLAAWAMALDETGNFVVDDATRARYSITDEDFASLAPSPRYRIWLTRAEPIDRTIVSRRLDLEYIKNE